MDNTINAIYVKSTQEILYLRCEREKVWSSDSSVKYTKYYTKITIPNNIINVKLNKNKLLDQILYYDYTYGNKNANRFPEGYHGKYQLNDGSNKQFFEELIINGFEKVWKYIK